MLLFSTRVWSKDTDLDIVVTANKMEQPAGQAAVSLQTVSRKEIEARSLKTVSEALQTLIGIDMGRRGTRGDDVDIRLRGSDRDEVLVMLDNIPVEGNNESRSYFLDLIPVTSIERIEVLRGPQSILYGSNAVGGVINIITRKGEPGRRLTLRWEGGAPFSSQASFFGSGGSERTQVAGSVMRTDEDGELNHDDLGSNGVHLNFSHQVTDDFTIDLGAFFVETEQDLPKDQIAVFTPAGTLNDYIVDDSNAKRRLIFTQQNLSIQAPLGRRASTHLLFGFNYLREKILNSNVGNAPLDETGAVLTTNSQYFRSTSYRGFLDWQNDFKVIDKEHLKDTVQAGFNYIGDHLDFVNNSLDGDVGAGLPFTSGYPTPGAKAGRTNYAFYFQDIFTWKHWGLTAGARFDRNSTFGSEWSPRVTTSYDFEKTHTRLKAVYAEGFHAPTIAEFYDAQVGGTVTALAMKKQQELSRSYEAGVEQRFWNDKIKLDATVFRVNYDRLLDIVQAVNHAHTWGLEGNAVVKPIQTVSFGGNYTYNKTLNEDDQTELTMRPQHLLNVFAQWEPFSNFFVRTDVRHRSSKLAPRVVSLTIGDFPVAFYNSDLATSDRLASSTVVDLSLRYQFKRLPKPLTNGEIYTHITNLFDETYEETFGYPMPGIGFRSGFSFNF